MSVFKPRGTTAPKQQLPVGTRTSPGSPSTLITSTGIASLDDILGGGLPLSCSQLTLAPDPHSAYGELVQRYFIAQGIASGQKVVVVDGDPRKFSEACMWTVGGEKDQQREGEGDEEGDEGTKVKIAWRYENMKRVQTTVRLSADEGFCSPLDLTCRIPTGVLDSANLTYIGVDGSPADALEAVRDALAICQGAQIPTRVCIPTLGAPEWGDMRSQDVLKFLYALCSQIRSCPSVCASIALVPHMCDEKWGGPGWIQKLAWLTDGVIGLTTFSGDPALSALFGGAYHGLARVYRVPGPHTLVPPSDRFSALRGLAGGGENNLAFKCTRRRFVLETMHLDVEGGVGERRTKPVEGMAAVEITGRTTAVGTGRATVEVEFEGETVKAEERREDVKKKPKKRVGFRTDEPNVYDF